MTGKVISVFSVKGGVGKTTMTLNLAGIYCSMGKRVLIIDMDLKLREHWMRIPVQWKRYRKKF